MRHFTVWYVGMALIVAAAGSVRGEDEALNVWFGDRSLPTWSDHLQRPPTFFLPGDWTPSIFAGDPPRCMFGCGQPVHYEPTNGFVGPIDRVTAEFIASDRKNSPASKFGESVQPLPAPSAEGADRFEAVPPPPAFESSPFLPPQPQQPAPACVAVPHAAPVYGVVYPHTMPRYSAPQAYAPPAPSLYYAPALAYRPDRPGRTPGSSATSCPCGISCSCATSGPCAMPGSCATSSCCATATCCSASATACENGCDTEQAAEERLEHLMQACHHLEAADMHDEANRVRKQCCEEMKDLLHRLKTAEEELKRLRNESAKVKQVNHELPMGCQVSSDAGCFGELKNVNDDKQVVVHLQLMEVNLTRLRELGFDFDVVGGDNCGKQSANCKLGVPYVDLEIEAQERQTGRLMLGVGVNSDAGLVGNFIQNAEKSPEIVDSPIACENGPCSADECVRCAEYECVSTPDAITQPPPPPREPAQ